MFLIILLIVTFVLCDRPMLSQDPSANLTYNLIKTTVNALDTFSMMFFWYLVAATGWWFVFFKLQERVYCFLPELDSFWTNYRPYDILWGLVVSAKLVQVFFKIVFE